MLQKKNVLLKKSRKTKKSNVGAKITNIRKTSTGSNLVKGSPKNEVRMSRREFIQEVYPNEGWAVQKFALNPGVSRSFPWLSGVARNFEKYVINKFTIEYRTAQSTFIPGKIQMAPDFDASDSAPMSKRELLTYTLATDGPVWQNFDLNLPKGYLMNQKKYYVRQDDNITGDIKLYDPCNIFIAADPVTTDVQYLGEIWINYDITLFEPQAPELPIDYSVLGKAYVFTNGITNVKPFGTGLLPSNELGKLDCILDMPNDTITFPKGFQGIVVQKVTDTSNFGQLPFNSNFYNIAGVGGSLYLGNLDLAVGGESQNSTGNDARMYVSIWDVPPRGGLKWTNTGGVQADSVFESFTIVLASGELQSLSL